MIAILGVLHAVQTYLIKHVGVTRGRFYLAIFNLDLEASFGTWFSTMLLLAIAVALWWISRSRAEYRTHWRWLAYLVLFMSCDEVASIHERFSYVYAWAKRWGYGLSPMFFFGWTIPALIALAVVTVLYIRFLIALPAHHRARMLMAAVCYFGGAVGVELWSSTIAIQENGTDSAAFAWLTLLEESLEMIGLALGLRAVLLVLTESRTELTVSVNQPVDSQSV